MNRTVRGAGERMHVRGNKLTARLMRFGASALIAAVLAVIGTAVLTMSASPAQAAPPPTPTPNSRQANSHPGLTGLLGGLGTKLALPPLLGGLLGGTIDHAVNRTVNGLLDGPLGGLLGGKPDPTPPTTGAPAPEPTTANSAPHPPTNAQASRPPADHTRHNSHVAAVPAAQNVPSQAGAVDSRPRHHAKPKRTTTSSPVSGEAAPALLRRALQPGSPVVLLAGVTSTCALGIAAVVLLGGRRRGSRRHA